MMPAEHVEPATSFTLPKVLVVDDEVAICEELRDLLETEDFEVAMAHDGEMAIERIRDDDTIGIVFTDLRMPTMGGLTLANVLREEYEDARPLSVVVVTGHGALDDAVGALKEGVVDFVTKPVTYGRTLEALEKSLEHWRHGQRKIRAEHALSQRVACQSARIEDLDTELREQNLRLKAANHTKAHFMRSMGHELHTPLHHIVSGLDILSEVIDLQSNPDAERWIGIVTEASHQLADHLSAILELAQVDSISARVESNDVDLIDMVVSLTRLYEDKARLRHQKIEVTDAGLPRPVVADRGRLMQALGYILENAIAYSPESSVLNVAVDFNGPEVNIIVTDEGPGMTADELAYASDPARHIRSATHSAEGAGLGIYLATRNVELQRGRISFHNTFAAGLQVQITLPKQDAGTA